MACQREDQAFKYAEGLLGDDTRDFKDHLSRCSACQETVRDSAALDGVLKTSLAREELPAGLAERLTARVLTSQPTSRPTQPARTWRLFGPHPRLAFAAAAIFVVAVVLVVLSPNEVAARLREALYFVPGIGITATDDSSLANARPVSAKVGDYEFTLSVLVSSKTGTTLKFQVTGLPGGKEAWAETRPIPVGTAPEAPDMPPDSAATKPPYLRDAAGTVYEIQGYSHGVGGDQTGQTMRGEMSFTSLPAGTKEATLVVPTSSLLPPSLATDSAEWVLTVPLVALDARHFAYARELSLSETRDGVTVAVVAASFSPQETGLSVRLSTDQGAAVPFAIGRQITPPELMPRLTDDQGREYKSIPLDGMRPVLNPMEVPLAFEAVGRDVTKLRLTVPVVSVQEAGEALVRIPVAGHNMGESWPVNVEVMLGAHKVRVVSATLEATRTEPSLVLTLDLGPREGLRQLVGLRVDTGNRSGGSWSSSDSDTGQTEQIGFPVTPSASEVVVTLREPMVAVYGDWSFEFAPTE